MDTPLNPDRSKRVEWGIVLGLSILYIVTFPFVHNLIGDSVAILSILPIISAGWFLGLKAGIIASLIAIAANFLLFVTLTDADLSSLAQHGFLPGAFGVIIVGIIAGQAGKFTQERRRKESLIRAREQFLAKLNAITNSILAAKGLDQILQRLAFELADLLESDGCHITHWDANLGEVILLADTSQTTEPAPQFKLDPGEADLTKTVLQQKHVLAVEDISQSPLFNKPILARLNCRSLLGIPLAMAEQNLGAAIITYQSRRHFTSEELNRAELAGSQLALALWDVQQSIELQRRLHESNALADIGRALSETERMGLNKVLQLIVEFAKDLIPGAERAVIHLLDTKQQLLIPLAVTGFSEPGEGNLNMRLGEGVAGQVIADGGSVNIADVETDPRLLRIGPQPRFRSLMVSAVQSGEDRLGTISVQSNHPNAFTPEEQQLLSSLGVQAAIAIENARLLETTKQGYKEINALYHLTRGLAASFDTAELMRDVVDLLHDSFGYYHIQIYILDTETGELVANQGSGVVGAQLMEQGHRLTAGVGIIGHVAETGQPFFTNDAENTLFFVPNPLLPNTQSELAVPIRINERVLGVLNVEQEPPNHLTERDLQLVTTVADQLAVALQKASLYSDLQVSLAQEKAVRSQLVQSERLALVGRLLASVSHELNNPLQAIQNALFLLKEDAGLSPQGRQDLQIIISEAERMAGLIERLRTSYRPTRLEDFQLVQINAVVEDVHALMATHLRHKEIAFEFHPDPDLPPVLGQPDQLRQVTLNLFMNAVEAMSAGGRLTVSTETNAHNEIILSISDTGPGIDPAILPQIFDAFVTSKEGGTGLGLTITYDIIHRHYGRIQVVNNPDQGATFSVWLPISQKELP